MIKNLKITILVIALFFIVLISCNKESTLTIQNNNQTSTNELKSLVNQVKVWHDSVVSNKVQLGTFNETFYFTAEELPQSALAETVNQAEPEAADDATDDSWDRLE